MKAVITVIGRDMVGILAKVSALCAQHNINVTDVTPSVMQDLFAMIMLADISSMTVHFSELVDEMEALGKEMGFSIHVMHEDIFNSMHRI